MSDYQMKIKELLIKEQLPRTRASHINAVNEALTSVGLETNYVLAGNSLNSTSPNDYDLFHFPYSIERLKALLGHSNQRIISSRNAITWIDKKVQFCDYSQPTPMQLVESFDFAHVQVGIVVELGVVKDVVFTEDYLVARSLNTTWFTGTEYPLSSLIRLSKYRHLLNALQHRLCVIQIVNEIIKRGYTGFDDLRDQLDAIDLQSEFNGGVKMDGLEMIIRANNA